MNPVAGREASLLQEVLEYPDEDTPRLIYADFLEDHGNPDRAEFIRIECRAVAAHGDLWWPTGTDPDCLRHAALMRRYNDLWLGTLPTFPGVRWWKFWRGFPNPQVDSWWALRRHARRIWELSPVEDVCVNWLTHAGAVGMARWTGLRRLRALAFSWLGRYGTRALGALLRSPHLAGLRRLDLKSCGVGDEGAVLLAHCTQLTGLRELNLECNDISSVGGLALARSPHLGGLDRLYLGRNNLGEGTRVELRKRFPRCC